MGLSEGRGAEIALTQREVWGTRRVDGVEGSTTLPDNLTRRVDFHRYESDEVKASLTPLYGNLAAVASSMKDWPSCVEQ